MKKLSGSNTQGKTQRGRGNGKPFSKGDPRINRKGRPKSFDTFRELALAIANEKVKVACEKVGLNPPTKESENLKVAEFILRKWAFSSEPKLQVAFTEVAFGKVPLTVENPEGGIEAILVQIVGNK